MDAKPRLALSKNAAENMAVGCKHVLGSSSSTVRTKARIKAGTERSFLEVGSFGRQDEDRAEPACRRPE